MSAKDRTRLAAQPARTQSAGTQSVGVRPVNAQYNVAGAGSLPVRVAAFQRRKMFDAFVALGIDPGDTVLDIGATSDRAYEHSNYLEAWLPHKDRLTALSNDPQAAFLEEAYPGLSFVTGDGRALEFADGAFDWVHSSAVLEHVGSAERQAAFVREAFRVARKGVFITTPNRWFPVEFHTLLPLAHWLPPRTFRSLLTLMGMDFFAREENLNLLSAKTLAALASEVCGEGGWEVRGVRLLGWTSNLLLVFRRG